MLIERFRVPGANVGFTNVDAGNLAFHILSETQDTQAVENNRLELEEHLGITPGTTNFVNQVHSAEVVMADDGWQSEQPRTADAIISPDGAHPLAIMVADCLPVVFTTNYLATAVAHAGRVGLLNGILENTVEALRALPATGEQNIADRRIQAFIGPSICGGCYEVPADMKRTAIRKLPEAGSKTTWGTPSLDLAAAAEAQLRRLGISVTRSDFCTREDTRLFSHRRSPGEGRIAGLVWPAQN